MALTLYIIGAVYVFSAAFVAVAAFLECRDDNDGSIVGHERENWDE